MAKKLTPESLRFNFQGSLFYKADTTSPSAKRSNHIVYCKAYFRRSLTAFLNSSFLASESLALSFQLSLP